MHVLNSHSLCSFMYCLCINVYCTAATGCQPIAVKIQDDTKHSDCVLHHYSDTYNKFSYVSWTPVHCVQYGQTQDSSTPPALCRICGSSVEKTARGNQTDVYIQLTVTLLTWRIR